MNWPVLSANRAERQRMENRQLAVALEDWIEQHAAAGNGTIYFRINGDIPVRAGNTDVFFEIPDHGRRILVMHPAHLTPVALLCHERGYKLIQVL